MCDVHHSEFIRRTNTASLTGHTANWNQDQSRGLIFRESFLRLSLANIDQRVSALFDLHHDAPIHLTKQSVRTAIELFCEVLENQGIFPLC